MTNELKKRKTQSRQDPGLKGIVGRGDQAAQPGSATHRNEQPRGYNQRAVQRDSTSAGHRNELPHGRMKRVVQRDDQPNDPMERVVQGDDRPKDHSDNEQEIDYEEVKDEATTRCRLFCLISVFGLCAAVCTAAAVSAGWVSFQYPLAYSEHSTMIADEELKDFENFLGELVSVSRVEHTKAVLLIPIKFHQARYQLDNAVDTVLKSELAREEWQEKIVGETKEISHLFRDAAEEIFDFLIRGRTMMKYMVDLGLPSIGKAFQTGDYATVLQVLEDMERHIKDADASITTAKVKVRDCNERSENVLESMQKEIPFLDQEAEKAGQGWSIQSKVAVYGLAMALTAAAGGALAVPLGVGVGVGAGFAAAGGAVGGGAAAMKHWIDNANGEELKQHLHSNAHNLEGAYNNMDVVRENLEQVFMNIRKLVIAVDEAKMSMSGLYGQLNPKKAKLFYYRLKGFSQRCNELHTLYDIGIDDYHKEDWRKYRFHSAAG